jgi:hypothetical protein
VFAEAPGFDQRRRVGAERSAGDGDALGSAGRSRGVQHGAGSVAVELVEVDGRGMVLVGAGPAADEVVDGPDSVDHQGRRGVLQHVVHLGGSGLRCDRHPHRTQAQRCQVGDERSDGLRGPHNQALPGRGTGAAQRLGRRAGPGPRLGITQFGHAVVCLDQRAIAESIDRIRHQLDEVGSGGWRDVDLGRWVDDGLVRVRTVRFRVLGGRNLAAHPTGGSWRRGLRRPDGGRNRRSPAIARAA